MLSILDCSLKTEAFVPLEVRTGLHCKASFWLDEIIPLRKVAGLKVISIDSLPDFVVTAFKHAETATFIRAFSDIRLAIHGQAHRRNYVREQGLRAAARTLRWVACSGLRGKDRGRRAHREVCFRASPRAATTTFFDAIRLYKLIK
jgi:hypothetical protein